MPWKDRDYARAYQRDYGRKLYAEGKTWAQNNPEKVKIKRRKRTLTQYGLTHEQWESMFASQGNCCAICKSSTTARFGWATDHNHSTGKVRGILCSSCNTGIGQMQDDSELLRLAANYIDKYK